MKFKLNCFYKYLFLVLIIFSIIQCKEKTHSNDLRQKLNEKLDNTKSKYDLLEKFNSISSKKNLMNEFNLNEYKIDNFNKYFKLNYFIDEQEKFYYGIKIKNIDNTNGNVFLYYFNRCLIKREKGNLYYLIWTNERKKGDSIETKNDEVQISCRNIIYPFNVSLLIDNSTTNIFTNIDSNIIRERFNFNGEINRIKIGKINFNFGFDESYNIVIKDEVIKYDSTSYHEYYSKHKLNDE